MVVSVRRHQHAHLPRRRSGHTTTVTIGAELFFLTANQRDDGSLGEVFIHWGKHGTSAAGLVTSYAVALSLGLQHHVPLAELIRPGLDQVFVPNGHTDDPEIPRVRSAVDYMARRQAMLDWYVPRQGPEFEKWLDALDAVGARIEAEKMFTFSTET